VMLPIDFDGQCGCRHGNNGLAGKRRANNLD
jgi:hypothetical protein